MEPGEYFLRDGMIEINAGRRTVKLQVSNTGVGRIRQNHADRGARAPVDHVRPSAPGGHE
jgi:hypothetical protein